MDTRRFMIFILKFPSSRMKVSMKMRIFFTFFELHSWD